MFKNNFFLNSDYNLFCNVTSGILYGKTIFKKMNAVNFIKKKTPIVYVMLSLDCDTYNDSYALKQINQVLDSYDIKVSIAATAKLVEKNVCLYDNFLSSGHELVNHGYSLHSGVDEAGRTYSTFFYNDVDWKFIQDEIEQAQRTYYNLFGFYPVGFRAPHFGVFQGQNEVLKLYEILKSTGFDYSSSVMVYNMLKNSWNFFSNDVIEIPVTNRVELPYSVIDSYSLVYNKGYNKRKNKFYNALKHAVDIACNAEHDMFINIYFDPSQMVDNEELKLSINYMVQKYKNIEFMRYGDFIKIIDENRNDT